MSGRYLTLRELEQLDQRLSERDKQIVQLLATLVLVAGAQIRRLYFPDEKKGRSDAQLTRRALLRLTRLGLLARLQRRIGGVKGGSDGFIYRLAPAGQRLVSVWAGRELARGRQWPEPGQRFVAHRLAVSELHVQLHQSDERGGLSLLQFQAEPDCWRTFLVPLRGAVTLKPDAFVRVAVGEYELWWFVEVDRGTVSQATRARQAAAYRTYWQSGAAAEVMPRVLWVARDRATAERVELAIRADLEPVGLFVVTTSERVDGDISEHEAGP